MLTSYPEDGPWSSGGRPGVQDNADDHENGTPSLRRPEGAQPAVGLPPTQERPGGIWLGRARRTLWGGRPNGTGLGVGDGVSGSDCLVTLGRHRLATTLKRTCFLPLGAERARYPAAARPPGWSQTRPRRGRCSG